MQPLIVDTEAPADCSVVYEDSIYPVSMSGLPYIAGYLAFREVPPLLQLLQKLRKRIANEKAPEPYVIMVDGNGILHPKRFGTASHLGVCANLRTIGVGKSLHCFGDLSRAKVKSMLATEPRQEHLMEAILSIGTSERTV